MADNNDKLTRGNTENEENISSTQLGGKPFSVDFSTTFKIENPIKNGTITSANSKTVYFNSGSIDIYKPRKYTVEVSTPDHSFSYETMQSGGENPTTVYDIYYDENNVRHELPKKIQGTELLFERDYSNQNDFLETPIVTLNDLRNYHNENGQSVDKTYDYLKNFINENKDDKETLKLFVSSFLNDVVEYYDSDTSHAGVGEQKELLSKLLNAEDNTEIDGLICGTIHEFMMDTLNECGIESAIVAGEYSGVNHATLIWKLDDGEYVFNNYGAESITVEASNIIDAVKEVEKSSGVFGSIGNITIYDGKNSYIEYAFTDSAYHGEKMDKRYYNQDNPFNQTFAKSSSLTGNMEVSNLGNMSLDTQATIVKNDNQSISQLNISLGAVKKGESSMFNESLSIGSEVGYQKSKVDGNTTTYSNFTGIASYVKGTTNSTSYTENKLINLAELNQYNAKIEDLQNFKNSPEYKQLTEEERAIIDKEIQSHLETANNNIKITTIGDVSRPEATNTSNHISIFGRGVWGKNQTILQSDTFTLNSGVELSGTFNATNKIGTTTFNGDFRVGAEGGFQLTNKSDTHLWQTNISAGVFGDFNPQHVSTNFNLINPGAKLNIGTGVSYAPSSNTVLGFRGDLSTTASASSNDLNLEGNIYGSYQTENGTRFTAMSGVEYESQRLTMGHINERTKNNTTFNVLLSGEKGNTTVYAGYSQHLDAMNKSRSNYSANVGVRYNF